jgi:hypothetical protein
MNHFRTPVGPPPRREERFPEDAPSDNGRLEAATTAVIRAILLTLTLMVFTAAYFIWLHWQTGQVEASRPIGRLLGMSGQGGWSWPLVIETEEGFFPLGEAVAIPKGTQLVLEDRASGKRFICDLKRTVCVQTSFESMPGPAGMPSPGSAR